MFQEQRKEDCEALSRHTQEERQKFKAEVQRDRQGSKGE